MVRCAGPHSRSAPLFAGLFILVVYGAYVSVFVVLSVHARVRKGVCVCVLSQDTVNWLGFASTCGCVLGGVGFGNLGDHVRSIKAVIIALFLVSTVLVGWFTLLANRVLSPSSWQLFTSCTLGRYLRVHSV